MPHPTTRRIAIPSLTAAVLAGGFTAVAAPSLAADKCDVPESATAKKVVLVEGTSGTKATVSTCEKTDDGYTQVAQVAGEVGYNGIAEPGAKREGDGKTPAGVFDLTDGFGVNAKPDQFAGGWTTVTGDHVWVDGDASKTDGYNTMQRKSDGYKGESLNQRPAYNFAQIVDYNPERTPGKGSAIFLHVNTGSGKTAGCVSVSETDLLKIFAWEGEDPTQIAIVPQADEAPEEPTPSDPSEEPKPSDPPEEPTPSDPPSEPKPTDEPTVDPTEIPVDDPTAPVETPAPADDADADDSGSAADADSAADGTDSSDDSGADGSAASAGGGSGSGPTVKTGAFVEDSAGGLIGGVAAILAGLSALFVTVSRKRN